MVQELTKSTLTRNNFFCPFFLEISSAENTLDKAQGGSNGFFSMARGCAAPSPSLVFFCSHQIGQRIHLETETSLGMGNNNCLWCPALRLRTIWGTWRDTELMAQLGKVVGSSKIHPEKDPFGGAAQIWIHCFWSEPQEIKRLWIITFRVIWASLVGSGVQSPAQSTKQGTQDLQAWRSHNLSLGNSISDQCQESFSFYLIPIFPLGSQGSCLGWRRSCGTVR